VGVLKDWPMLNLIDDNGKIRFELNVTKDGPILSLKNEKGEVTKSLP
jgi:hypothetical protein